MQVFGQWLVEKYDITNDHILIFAGVILISISAYYIIKYYGGSDE